MSKSNKIIERNNMNIKALAVKKLADEFKVSRVFVNMALRNDRDSETATQIKKAFPFIYDQIEASTK